MKVKILGIQFQSTPPSLAETVFSHETEKCFKISIHSAIASGDDNYKNPYSTFLLFQSTPPSLAEILIVKRILHPIFTFQSTPPSLAETANSHILLHTIRNNHVQFAHISSNQFIQSSHFPSIAAKFSVRTSQGFYDHFWFAP